MNRKCKNHIATWEVRDALRVAAGWLRIHWQAALGFMAAGRLARCFVVAWWALV